MVGKDDETRTAESTSDPALDATIPATPASGPSAHLDAAREPQPNDLIGRYRVVEVIGRGGMGVVYRARDPELDRELAIKVVRPGSGSRRAQDRLLAEARAMAKLRHPAVVPVFDVGATSDGVYIVMPLISGGTMYEWMREGRSWREVVDRFLTAGRGLAAAHAAGLVHRDFKPRNVLMGTAGEVLVADFGIAAQTNDSIAPALGATSPGSAQASSIAGTPAYMAPEQCDGCAIDARADQYSFCISFWEALCGQRPTDADTRTRSVVPSSGIAHPSSRKGVPGWLLDAVARGFAASPAERWPSLELLLRHIESRLNRPRRVAAVAGAVALATVASGAVFLTRGRGETPCPDPAPRLANVWTPAIRREVEAAFDATGAPYAKESFARIATALDSYTNGWRSMQIQVCRAGVVEHTESSELHDRRMLCLDRHLDRLRGRTGFLRQIDASALPRAIELVTSLPPLADCEDKVALLEQVAPPADARVRKQMVELERRIVDVDVIAMRDRPEELVRKAMVLATEARAFGHAPTLALALRAVSNAEELNHVSAEATLRELATVASQAKDDAAVTIAWARLVYELARLERPDEAKALEPVAEAALTRAGGTPELVFRVRIALGGRAAFEGDMLRAKQQFEQALAVASEPVMRSSALKNLAIAQAQSGEFISALAFVEKALEAAEQGYGSRHPGVADVLVLRGMILNNTGDPADLARAEAAFARALEIRIGAFGKENPRVANTLSAMATSARIRGEFGLAETHLRQAISIYEKQGLSGELAVATMKLADNVADQRGISEARPLYERTLELAEKVGGRSDATYIAASLNLSTELVDIGDCVTPRLHAKHAFEVMGEADRPELAVVFQILGKCEFADGNDDAGIAWFTRAIELCTKKACMTGNLEDLQFSLATKLVEKGRDRKRAVELMRNARVGFAAIGREDMLAEIDKWLAKHAR